MDGFDPLQIPFYHDDTFLFQDTMPIFQDLHHHGTCYTDPSAVIPSVETHDHQVFTASTSAAVDGGRKREKRGRKPLNDGGDKNCVGNPEKRAVHRDIERQRRQEMSHLYASLRTLLPLEYIKGKRAITDHVQEAVNYIKHKEKTIRELELKRNKLQNQLGDTCTAMEARRFSSSITFTVGSCSGGGIEILMSSDLADDWFPLSRVMKVLLNEGLTVVNCTYNKLGQKLHCTIRTDEGGPQMNEGDICLLREKLDAKVSDWRSLGASSC